MKVNKDEMLAAIETVIRMDKSPIKRLEWDEFKTTVNMFNGMGTCVEAAYIGTSSPVNIMLVVAARASALKGGR